MPGIETNIQPIIPDTAPERVVAVDVSAPNVGRIAVTAPESDTQIYSIAEVADYDGNWMNLQHERMESPDFRTKFNRFLSVHTPSLSAGTPGILDKASNFQDHYVQQREGFDKNLEYVNGAVGYGPFITMGGKSAASFGHGNIGERGTVYTDAATIEKVPLTPRQKDIIAAHEAYHGMVDAQGSAQVEVKSGFDWETHNQRADSQEVKHPGYLRNPDELLARMAQFKNYFGMRGGEAFTPEHLAYLRDHYVVDTGLDNDISAMLAAVTPKTESQFLTLMNTLPL